MRLVEVRVAIDRLQTFLDEDEVDEQVSSLKSKPATSQESNEQGLGFDHASFKWNEVDEAAEAKKKTDRSPTTASSATDATVMATEIDVNDRRFELLDLSVIFPAGKLTIITGPSQNVTSN